MHMWVAADDISSSLCVRKWRAELFFSRRWHLAPVLILDCPTQPSTKQADVKLMHAALHGFAIVGPLEDARSFVSAEGLLGMLELAAKGVRPACGRSPPPPPPPHPPNVLGKWAETCFGLARNHAQT